MGSPTYDPLKGDPAEKPGCPRCKRNRIKRRTRNEDKAGKWRCADCGVKFNIPIYGVPKHKAQTTRPNLSAAGRAAIEWAKTNR